MKTKVSLIIALIILLSLSIGCVKKPKNNEAITVMFDDSDREDIFEDMSDESIEAILRDIGEMIASNSKYRTNPDLAIEKVFKRNKIGDRVKIESAKNKLIIKNI